MALGARRLMAGHYCKKIQIVETLGSATVICLDKTSTITQNQMSLQAVYVFANRTCMKLIRLRRKCGLLYDMR